MRSIINDRNELVNIILYTICMFIILRNTITHLNIIVWQVYKAYNYLTATSFFCFCTISAPALYECQEHFSPTFYHSLSGDLQPPLMVIIFSLDISMAYICPITVTVGVVSKGHCPRSYPAQCYPPKEGEGSDSLTVIHNKV